MSTHAALLLFLQLHKLVAMNAKEQRKMQDSLFLSWPRSIGHEMHVIV